MHTGNPVQNIFLVFWNEGHPLLRGWVTEVNLNQPVVGCPLISAEDANRTIVGYVLWGENSVESNYKCQFTYLSSIVSFSYDGEEVGEEETQTILYV